MATSAFAKQWLAYGALALSMSLVGSYVALSKPLAAVFPVFLLGWLRFGIGVMAMARWLRRPRAEPAWTPQTRRLVFLESFLGNFLFTLCMITGVSLTGAVAAGVIMSLIPAMVALLSRFFLHEAISFRVWLAIGLGVTSMLVLSLGQAWQGNTGEAAGTSAETWRLWVGNALLLGAVLCEAFYAVIGKKLTRVLSARRISALINLWGFALMTPFGLVLALQFDFSGVPFSMWLLLVFYALAASVWTVWLWMTGLESVPASQAGVFTVLLPVSAAVVGVVVLKEPFSYVQLVAFAGALAGLLLVVTAPGVKDRSRVRSPAER